MKYEAVVSAKTCLTGKVMIDEEREQSRILLNT